MRGQRKISSNRNIRLAEGRLLEGYVGSFLCHFFASTGPRLALLVTIKCLQTTRDALFKYLPAICPPQLFVHEGHKYGNWCNWNVHIKGQEDFGSSSYSTVFHYIQKIFLTLMHLTVLETRL